MTMQMDTILSHWKSLIAIWVAINFVLAMPSPGKKGAPDTWWYNTLYGGLHTLAGALPRLFITLFPQSFISKFLGGNGQAPPAPASPVQ